MTLIVPFDHKGIKDFHFMSLSAYEPNKKCLHINPFHMDKKRNILRFIQSMYIPYSFRTHKSSKGMDLEEQTYFYST